MKTTTANTDNTSELLGMDYETQLRLSYGNNDRVISDQRIAIATYESCPGANRPLVQQRIAGHRAILEIALSKALTTSTNS